MSLNWSTFFQFCRLLWWILTVVFFVMVIVFIFRTAALNLFLFQINLFQILSPFSWNVGFYFVYCIKFDDFNLYLNFYFSKSWFFNIFLSREDFLTYFCTLFFSPVALSQISSFLAIWALILLSEISLMIFKYFNFFMVKNIFFLQNFFSRKLFNIILHHFLVFLI